MTICRERRRPTHHQHHLDRFEESLTANFRATGTGVLIACNRTFAQTLGLASPMEARGRTLATFFAHSAQYDHVIDELRSEHQSGPIDCELRTSEGRSAHVTLVVSLQHDRDGEPIEFRGSFLDRTRQQRAGERREDEARSHSIGRLAGGVAHDYNNLLTAILGFADLASSQPELEPPTTRALEQIQAAASKAAELTDQLLTYSGRQVFHQPEVLDLSRLLVDLKVDIERQRAADQHLIYDLSPALWSIEVDRRSLEGALVQLLAFSLSQASDGGWVRVETTNFDLDQALERDGLPIQAGRYVVLQVSDNGDGVEEAERRQIFEPFFLDWTESRVGLGLSTLQGIARQSDGHLFFDSETGVGSRFELWLPADASLPAAESFVVEPAPPKTRLAGRVQVYLEDANLRRYAVSVLEGVGIEPIVIDGLSDAAQRSAQTQADLLITDLLLPGLNGPEFVAEARRHQPSLRALLLVGAAPPNLEADEIGEATLRKPFTPGELVEAVQRLLER